MKYTPVLQFIFFISISLLPDVAKVFHNALFFYSFFPPTSLFNYVNVIIPPIINIPNNFL
jgi:hypothetical protein